MKHMYFKAFELKSLNIIVLLCFFLLFFSSFSFSPKLKEFIEMAQRNKMKRWQQYYFLAMGLLV